MKVPPVSRKSWLVLSTILIVAAMFAYYFLVYMELRQRELEDKKFRMLGQYATNIAASYQERTKREVASWQPGEIDKDYLGSARKIVLKSVANRADFNELVFECDSEIEFQTFENKIGSLESILKNDNADVVRLTEYTLNNRTFIVFIHQFELNDKTKSSPHACRLVGFCEKDQFTQQVRSVKLIYVLGASFFLILLVLLMPVLKLMVMNEIEKLQMINVWFCGFSIVVGGAILVLTTLMTNDYLVSYDSYVQQAENNRDHKLGRLGEEIATRFTTELDAIYSQFEASFDTCTFLDTLNSIALDSTRFSHHPYFNEMLWLDKNGDPNMIVATHELEKSDKFNISARKYFSKALHDSTWFLPNDSQFSKRFALQSIHSYNSNSHEAGFGINVQKRGECDSMIRSEKTAVFAIATRLNSVMDVLLPPGYSFAMIDQSGLVWFHSDIEKNAHENFLDETGRDNRLLAAIEARLTKCLSINYEGVPYRIRVDPIPNTELHLLVLHNTEYFNTPIVLTVGLASYLVVVLLLIQGFHQLILFVTTREFSMLKVKRFFMAWLRPQKERFQTYQYGLAIQFALVLFLIIAISISSHASYLVVYCLTLPVYLHCYHYFTLERDNVRINRIEQRRVFGIHPFLLTSCVVSLIINLSGFYFFTEWMLTVVLQVLTITMLTYGYHKLKNLKEPAMNDVSRFLRTYTLYLFLWLMLTSILPTYFFYVFGHYKNGLVWSKFIELSSAKAIEKHNQVLEIKTGENLRSYVPRIKSLGNYLTTTADVLLVKRDSIPTVENIPFDELVFEVAPEVVGLAEQTRATILSSTEDSKWNWRHADDSEGVVLGIRNEKGNFLHAPLTGFVLFKGDYWYVMLFAIIGGMLVLWIAVRFCIRSIFGIGYFPPDIVTVPILEKRSRFIIVGVPCTGSNFIGQIVKKTAEAEKTDPNRNNLHQLQSEDPNFIEVLLDKACETRIPDKKSIIIALNLVDPHATTKENENRMKMLRSLQSLENPVIIKSTREPSFVFEELEKKLMVYRTKRENYELDDEYRKCVREIQDWKYLLARYTVHYYPLSNGADIENPLIKSEIDHGSYLPRLLTQLDTTIENRKEREEMVISVEQYASLYYQEIWSNLTHEEKFLLHDLAKDRFANLRNKRVISILRQKGILLLGNSLQIMNKSFSNFILTAVREDEELKMEESTRRKGAWNTLHLILVITIVSILVFLGIAEQRLFENFQGLIGTLGALLPLLARFGGIFSGSKAKD